MATQLQNINFIPKYSKECFVKCILIKQGGRAVDFSAYLLDLRHKYFIKYCKNGKLIDKYSNLSLWLGHLKKKKTVLYTEFVVLYTIQTVLSTIKTILYTEFVVLFTIKTILYTEFVVLSTTKTILYTAKTILSTLQTALSTMKTILYIEFVVLSTIKIVLFAGSTVLFFG